MRGLDGTPGMPGENARPGEKGISIYYFLFLKTSIHF